MGIHKKYSVVYQYFKFVVIYKKGTTCLFYSHNFYVYPYFKIYGYKKGTMCLFYSRNFYVYPYFNYKKELCE